MKEDLAYYLTLFKLEGHQKIRAHLSQKPNGLEEMLALNKEGVTPKVTEKTVIRIDRVTGLRTEHFEGAGTFKELEENK